MDLKMNLIAAACENMGIGRNKTLPWRLKSEMNYFTEMTSTTLSKDKHNAVIMGRKCWESIPPKFRPLSNRLNIVLSRTLPEKPIGVDHLCRSLSEAVALLSNPPLSDEVETVWNIGGHDVYKAAIEEGFCHRIYLTRVLAHFDCDVFFPPFDLQQFRLISLPEIPGATQTENGIDYRFEVYEKSAE